MWHIRLLHGSNTQEKKMPSFYSEAERTQKKKMPFGAAADIYMAKK